MFSSAGSDPLFGSPSESRSLVSGESRSLFGGLDNSGSGCAKPATQRYGALSPSDTKWLTSPERCLNHAVSRTDTLQGISVKYSVPIELLKATNKIFNSDQLFLRDSILIPVPNVPVTQRNGSHKNHVTSPSASSYPVGNGRDHPPAAPLDNTPTPTSELTPPTPTEDNQLNDLFSRFDKVLATTKESTARLRSNSNLDFSPQLANVASLTRSGSTASIVEPGPHGSRTTVRTRYKRGRRDFYTDDELPPSSSDEIYQL